jgi:hypothetical protein
MSTVHDTTNLKPYKVRTAPTIDATANLVTYLVNELQTISANYNAAITALKSIEARIVAGGL